MPHYNKSIKVKSLSSKFCILENDIPLQTYIVTYEGWGKNNSNIFLQIVISSTQQQGHCSSKLIFISCYIIDFRKYLNEFITYTQPQDVIPLNY